MKIIVPCAGQSSRFPKMAPKWMLPDHDGVPMVVRAVEGISHNREDFVFTILREHDEMFHAKEGLARAFGGKVKTVVLDKPTKSQSETVFRTIIACGLDGPILVKDSDNFFELDSIAEDVNYISVSSLNDFDLINARNKSYILSNQEGEVLSIREKHVISDLFSVGGYYFTSAQTFCETFERLNKNELLGKNELYISEIISKMILDGEQFRIKRASRYQDWGTVAEWRNKLSARRTVFASLDGFVLERGSAHFSPMFSEVKPHMQAVDALRKLAESKQKIVYLSIRAEKYRELTEQQMVEFGLPEGRVVFDCGIAPWSLFTAAHPSMPFSTANALELAPEDSNLLEKIVM